MRSKRLFAAALSVAMVISLAACGGKKDDNKNPDTTPNATVTVAPDQNDQKDNVAEVNPGAAENTVGAILWNEFKEELKKNPSISTAELAGKLVKNSVIDFAADSKELEPGYLAGFSEEIKDFESGAAYAPMMGSIAFVGHVFKLAEGADVKAFVENLKNCANPRWNICVEADYVQIGSYGNYVFSLMYPAFMDEDLGGGAGNVDLSQIEIIRPEVKENTWGALLWDSFEVLMTEEPTLSAIDAAFALSMDESITFTADAAQVEEGYLQGFDEEIYGFKSAGCFGPLIGSTAFVGYVFELPEGADVNAFLNTLKTTCNPGWNICVEAEQTVAGAFGNTVFFLMCNESNGVN